jgi:SET domain-containing protein
MSARVFRVGRSMTGLGLFAVKVIRRGDYIATYRGPRIPNLEADRREARGSRYMFTIDARWTIDGSPRWNKARYINHSCEPNANAVYRNGRIVIVALRRIEAGAEITYDYGQDYLDLFFKDDCRCAVCLAKKERSAPRRRR